MRRQRTWMRKALLPAVLVTAPALVGLSCESILGGPVVGPGAVDEVWFQGRVSEFLLAMTQTPSGDPMRLIAQFERQEREPSFPVPTVASGAFDYIFTRMAALEDTSDFRAMDLVNLLYGYRNHPALTPEVVAEIEDALLAYKFWWDEPTPAGVTDNNYYWSENHQLIFHTIEFLMGQAYPDRIFTNDGRTGTEHVAHARPLILDWLDHRMRFGFAEWHSDVYYHKDIEPLITLIEWAEDDEIRTRAGAILDVVLYDIAAHSLRGNMGVTHGRSYKKDKTKARDQDVFAVSKLLFDQTVEPYGGGGGGVTLLARSERYRLPEAILRIARSQEVSIDRQRMNLPIPELVMTPEQQMQATLGQVVYPPPVHGVSFSDPKDFNVWLAQAALTAWPVVPHTIDMLETHDYWQSEHFVDFLDLRSVIASPEGLNTPFAQIIALGLARMLSFGQLSEVNTYTYRTPDFMLSTAQSYRPGNRSDQRHTWQATIDERAIVFTNHPGMLPPVSANWGDDNEPGPSYWTGEATLPRSAQHENVGIHIYAPQYVVQNSGVARLISRYQPFTHAFFPQSRFDEVVQDGHWVFGRRGDGYVALWSWREPAFLDYTGTGWATDGMDLPFDLRAEGGPDNVWIVECGSRSEWGDFAAFRAALAGSRIDVTSLGPPPSGAQSSGFDVRFESPSRGVVEFGWMRPLSVGGEVVPIDGYLRHDSPWAEQAFGDRRLLIMDRPSLADGYGVWIDFDAGTRRSFGPSAP